MAHIERKKKEVETIQVREGDVALTVEIVNGRIEKETLQVNTNIRGQKYWVEVKLPGNGIDGVYNVIAAFKNELAKGD